MDRAIFVRKATTNSWYVADRFKKLLGGFAFRFLNLRKWMAQQTTWDIRR